MRELSTTELAHVAGGTWGCLSRVWSWCKPAKTTCTKPPATCTPKKNSCTPSTPPIN